MSKVIKYMPELQGEEQLTIAQIMTDMTEEQAEQFARVYRQRRKDDTTVLLTTLLAILGIAGVNRFYLGQVGMGIAYLLTAGFCLIGSIVDIVNYRSLAHSYNEKQALDVGMLIRGAFPKTIAPAEERNQEDESELDG